MSPKNNLTFTEKVCPKCWPAAMAKGYRLLTCLFMSFPSHQAF